MKPEIYAAKKAIVPIPIAMMRMIRSSLVIPANMTQDRGVLRLNISWPVVLLRGVSEGSLVDGLLIIVIVNENIPLSFGHQYVFAILPAICFIISPIFKCIVRFAI